jgi:hypothetical protein
LPITFTDRRNGKSVAPYDSFNLAHHVGDIDSSVSLNRQHLSKTIGCPIQFMNQVHGGDILEVTEIVADPTCDALITSRTGIALAVMVADCIPLLLSSATVIAAVHVGRRGLANSIASNTVKRMLDMGAINIQAHIGPSICGQCYEVSQELMDEFKILKPKSISTTRHATPALDLPAALISDLLELNVKIDVSEICTLENVDYFSYRRNTITGRTAGVIWL